MRRPPLDALTKALLRASDLAFHSYLMSVLPHMYGPHSVFQLQMRLVLRRRARYGGRKGRRAARRLAEW